MAARASRLQRELRLLDSAPPTGVTAWPEGERMDTLSATLTGPDDTPYAGGLFELRVVVPERYPFEPPSVRFKTPVYHPNIDSAGRICLDTLKMPPKGSWSPSVNILTLLTTIRLLLAHPNPDDGLMAEISREFKDRNSVFLEKARQHTLKHAVPSNASKRPVDETKDDESSSSSDDEEEAVKRRKCK